MPDFDRIKKLDELLKYLNSLHPKYIDFNLDRIKSLLKKLGNPQNKLPIVIHVAGTNGKGSSIAFIKSIAESYGLKVNCYISPHLINFNERIILNGELIEDDFLFENLYEVTKANNDQEITFFEITTAACFLAFSKVQSNICLIETGLGGRLDATNVIENKNITVLTKIGFDHVEFLGNDLKTITSEKCGILQRNAPCVVGKQNNSLVKTVIFEEAKKKKIQILKLRKIPKTWSLGLLGDHQYENAEIAVTVMKFLFKNLKNQTIKNALKSTTWDGRLQKIEKGKFFKNRANLTLVDGAHNLEGGKVILNYFKKSKINNWLIILGMMRNKNVVGFIDLIKEFVKTIFVVPIQGQRSCFNEIELEQIIKTNFNLNVMPFKNIDTALKNVPSNEPLFITGSLYLTGELLKKNK